METIERDVDTLDTDEFAASEAKDDAREPAHLAATPLQTEWVSQRPKRAKLTAEESIRRTKDFIENGKEEFIASIRKSKG